VYASTHGGVRGRRRKPPPTRSNLFTNAHETAFGSVTIRHNKKYNNRCLTTIQWQLFIFVTWLEDIAQIANLLVFQVEYKFALVGYINSILQFFLKLLF
jgi:hypothetical protein